MTALSEADDLLVAELAFGLLDANEEAAARVRVSADPALANRLAAWKHTAVTLVRRNDPPRPSLWQEIDARLPGNDNAAQGWTSTARWQAASAALGVLAAVLGALALRPAQPPPAPAPVPASRTVPPPLVAVLRGTAAAGTVAVTFDPESRRLTLAAEALDTQAGSAELWAIAGSAPPQSLGLVPTGAPAIRTVRGASRLIAPGVTLAVSLEPRGGSPNGAPSGTPVLTGTVAVATPAGSRPDA